MSQTPCTIFDCEYKQYYEGVIKGNIVYIVRNDTILPAKEHVCPYVDYDLVQFYIGNYEPYEDEDYNKIKNKVQVK